MKHIFFQNMTNEIENSIMNSILFDIFGKSEKEEIHFENKKCQFPKIILLFNLIQIIKIFFLIILIFFQGYIYHK